MILVYSSYIQDKDFYSYRWIEILIKFLLFQKNKASYQSVKQECLYGIFITFYTEDYEGCFFTILWKKGFWLSIVDTFMNCEEALRDGLLSY